MTVEAKERTGTILDGKWRLDRKLGEGGMGAVYAAMHVRTAKRVAVKLLHPGIASQDTITRFHREGYLANIIDDPGVVSVIDDGIDADGTRYLVMELLEGESLEDRSDRTGGTLPLDDLVTISARVLEILDKAHRAGVIHRDLKPSNLFVGRDGAVKILDFGLAGLVAAPHLRVTAPNAPTMGTLGFMPPEQVKGEWDLVDGRSDLWAMGATMFALMTGYCVHERGPEHQFMKRAMIDPAPALGSVRSDVPRALAAVVDRALAYDPADRFQTALELRDALLAAWRGASVDPLSRTDLDAARSDGFPERVPGALASAPTMPSRPAADVAARRAAATLVSPASPDRKTSARTAAPVSVSSSHARPSSGRAVPIALFACALAGVVVWAIVRTPPREQGSASPSSVEASREDRRKPDDASPSASAAPQVEPLVLSAPGPTASADAPSATTTRPIATAKASAEAGRAPPSSAAAREPSAPTATAGGAPSITSTSSAIDLTRRH
jgi:serine/threonine-protein kinase